MGKKRIASGHRAVAGVRIMIRESLYGQLFNIGGAWNETAFSIEEIGPSPGLIVWKPGGMSLMFCQALNASAATAKGWPYTQILQSRIHVAT